jgi:catechol 2,3-dioxygenase-like lactoylglutathione lyase family enzyme
MSLELYMVGAMVKDMDKALEFYRRLGVAFPEESKGKDFIGVKMGSGLTFFVTTMPDPARVAPSGGYRILLEFNLQTREAVKAKYREMLDFGYESYREPFETPFGALFAMINDPDGNTILLSA